MKEYEVWMGDEMRWVSSWNDYTDACQEADRLNNKFNRDFFVRRRLPDGTLLS